MRQENPRVDETNPKNNVTIQDIRRQRQNSDIHVKKTQTSPKYRDTNLTK